MDREKIEAGVRLILEGVGEDPEREGLRDAGARGAHVRGGVRGPEAGPGRALSRTTFDEHHEEMVLVRDIPFYSHVRAPPGAVLRHGARGLHPWRPMGASAGCRSSRASWTCSRSARRCRSASRRRSPTPLIEQLRPQGVIVVLEAEHLCMSMRGVKKAGAKTTTSAVRGAFERSQATRAEALSLIFARRD